MLRTAHPPRRLPKTAFEAALSLATLLCVATPVRAVPPPAVAAAPGPDTVAYQVRKGDTLAIIARSFLTRPDAAGEVQRLNGIADPDRLRPGATLRVPRNLLRTVPIDARIVAFRGQVTVNDSGGAKVGAVLREGARVTTGVNGSITLGLADNSKITLPSVSAIRIARLRLIPISGEVQRSFLLEAGRAETEVTPNRRARYPFEIRTPVSVAAVRGTVFRVSVGEGGRSATTSVLRGEVGVAGKSGETNVPQDFGVRSDAESTGKAVPLLPPPEFDPPVDLKRDGTQVFRLRPAAGAARYHLQIASDVAFTILLADVTRDKPELDLPPIEEGTFHIRASAIDVNDIEGLPTISYRYTYRLPPGVSPPGTRGGRKPG